MQFISTALDRTEKPNVAGNSDVDVSWFRPACSNIGGGGGGGGVKIHKCLKGGYESHCKTH